MVRKLMARRIVWMLVGGVAGVGLALALHNRPVQATATDHSEEFAMATGLLQRDLEAVYLLDFKTGMLLGTVMNTQTGRFHPFSRRRLARDFNLSPRARPRFVMVTGRMTSASAPTPVNHVLYVAELNTGLMCAYYIPYLGATTTGSLAEEIQLLDRIQFRGGIMPGLRR